MCLITIGLPVYNAAPFLADAIRSVLAQTLTDWALLVIDDGSTDGSLAVAQSFIDPRIRVITDGVNRGLAARLNQIAQLADGHYLARMDADDLMTPDRLQIHVDFMRANPEVDVVGALAFIIDTQNQVYGIRGTTQVPTTFRKAANGVALIHPTVLARTSWFLKHPYREDCNRAEDFDLWLRTVETSLFAVIDQPLLYYRERGLPQLKKYIQTARDSRAVLRRYRDRLEPWQLNRLLLTSYGKEWTYRLADRIGLLNQLLNRRNRLLPGAEIVPQMSASGHEGRSQPWVAGIRPAIRIVQVFTVPESLRFIEGQPAFLAGHGYDVQVVSAGGQVSSAFASEQGVRHHTIPFTRRVAPIRDLVCLLKTYRLFRRLQPVLIHGNTPKAGLISMLAAWLNRVPVRIYEIHGFPFESRRGVKRVVLIALEKLTCQLARQVLAVSESMRALAVKENIVADAKITVLHYGSCNGVDAADRFNPARLDPQQLVALKAQLRLSKRVIGFVGRLTRDKGIYELLDAWAVIRVAYPDVILLLVGQAEADFEGHATLQNDTRICAVGHVADVACYYALMDFLVLPTHREGFGNVLIEAAAMERPAVVSRVTGTVDAVVDNHTGLFCEARSVDSLTRQLSWYLDHPAAVRLHGQHARQRVLTDFVPSATWTAKWQFYEQLLTPVELPENQPISL